MENTKTIKEKHQPKKLTKVTGNGYRRQTIFCYEERDYLLLFNDAAELEAELRKLREQVADLDRDNKAFRELFDANPRALYSEVDMLRELIPYAQHKEDCEFGKEQYAILIQHRPATTDPKPCTCGLTDLLNTIKAS